MCGFIIVIKSEEQKVPVGLACERLLHVFSNEKKSIIRELVDPSLHFYFVGLRMLLLLHAIIPCLYTVGRTSA